MTDNFGYKEHDRQMRDRKPVSTREVQNMPWVKVMLDLYSDLAELTKGEECDHAVNICWCNVFDHMNKAKEMLNRVCADL